MTTHSLTTPEPSAHAVAAPGSAQTSPDDAQTSGASAALEAIDTLDDTLNQKARMKIMTTLLALGEADFKLLKEQLALSDGNLSTHLTLLEERGYISAHKEFVRRKPHSSYKPTDAGREAFHRYINGLMQIVRAAGGVDAPQTAGQMGTPGQQPTAPARLPAAS